MEEFIDVSTAAEDGCLAPALEPLTTTENETGKKTLKTNQKIYRFVGGTQRFSKVEK